MGWKLGDIHKRSKAHASFGRELETQVEDVLAKMKKNGKIGDFTRHAPFLTMDKNGKDFTVSVNGTVVSFGVTISSRLRRHKKRHPDIPHFSFPVGTSSEVIKERILGLFSPVVR